MGPSIYVRVRFICRTSVGIYPGLFSCLRVFFTGFGTDIPVISDDWNSVRVTNFWILRLILAYRPRMEGEQLTTNYTATDMWFDKSSGLAGTVCNSRFKSLTKCLTWPKAIRALRKRRTNPDDT